MTKPLTIEQLITDESFISYCLRNDTENTLIWQNYLLKYPEENERISKACEEVRRLYNALIIIEQEKGLEQLKVKIDILNGTTPKQNIRKIYHFNRAWIAIAATVLLTAFASLWYVKRPAATVYITDQNHVDYSTKIGERKRITLPDGTTINLNVASKLSISTDFNQKERNVYLEGEAFFEVAKDKEKPFIIHAQTMDIRVLGTVFNVKAYKNDTQAQAALIEGSIEVTLKNNSDKKVYLKPLDKISVSKQGAVIMEKGLVADASQAKLTKVEKISEKEVSTELSWLENKLVFNQESFEQIALTLERWYGVKFVFENENKRSLSFQATFRNSETLDGILSSLQGVEPFRYRREGDTIYIN